MLLREPEPATQVRRPGRALCRHCGSPLARADAGTAEFCCLGCAYVHRLIAENGHEAYYRLKNPVTPPADPAVFQPRDYFWLEDLQRRAEEAGRNGVAQLELEIQGISCAACLWLVERVSTQQAGVREARANAATGSIVLRWNRGAFSAAAWARRLQAFGYLVGPPGAASDHLESASVARRIGLCAAFALNVMLFTLPAYFGMRPDFAYAGLFRLLALLFATLSVLTGGGYFFSRALLAAGAKRAHIDQPIAIGIAGAYVGSLYGWLGGDGRYLYFDFVATFTLLMLIGRWAQLQAVERNRRRLLRCQPVAMKVRLASGERIPRDLIQAGQSIEIAPGQTLPVDALLEDGTALFSLASINGEAEPAAAAAGSRVSAGAINVGRSGVRLRTLQAWGESLLAQLQAAPASMAERSTALGRVVGGYVVGIIALSLLSGLAWGIAGRDWVRAGSVSIAVLVVSCPCAIGLALPLTEEMATVAARNRGVFIRDAGLWSRLGCVRHIVFDKTGTLTLDVPVLRNPQALAGLDSEERDALAGLVQEARHPVGECLWGSLLASGSVAPLSATMEETPGFGVMMGRWSLGRAGWRDDGPPGSETVFARDGIPIARFSFLDSLRPNAAEELAALSRMGYTIHILSGDHPDKVATTAATLDLPVGDAIGGLTPGGKADWILSRAPDRTLMLGDGLNDSLAFDRALCRGTPVVHRGVLEAKSDFYYLQRGLEGIRGLFIIDRARRRTQRAVIAFSILYNVFAAGFAAAGRINPLVAAVLMPLSSVASLLIVGLGMRGTLAGALARNAASAAGITPKV